MHDIRVEWGADGVAAWMAVSDAVVIVDVLSFSTCVDVAVGRGAVVLPFTEGGDAAAAFAAQVGATCAGPRGRGGFSLSPASFTSVPAGTRVVLPSPNGATLSLQASAVPTFAGCLRNATAVAQAAARFGGRITVIAAGERWPSSGRLRPALEDWLGAGAVVAALAGRRSPEAEAARLAFVAVGGQLDAVLRECVSGQWLIDRGYGEDVVLAARHDVSRCAPLLRDGGYRDAAG